MNRLVCILAMSLVSRLASAGDDVSPTRAMPPPDGGATASSSGGSAFGVAGPRVVAALVGPSDDVPAVGTHVPPAEAAAGAAIELVADAAANGPAPILHYRPVGAVTWNELELARRPDNRWVATIPATAAVPPGVEYYIDRGDAPVFASPAAPFAVVVRAAAADERKAIDLARVRGKRSRVHVTGEWVDFGETTIGDQDYSDSYYRIDADFAYRLLAYPIEEIRVGYTRLIGSTAQCEGGCREVEAGYKVGGWFELGLGVTQGVRVDGRLLVLATAEGFAIGGRGELRVGNGDGSHVAFGGEYAADVGATGFFRLGWDTVPRVPMAATVEVGNLPSVERVTGVRLVYDAFVPLAPGIRAGLRAGYAARDQRVGGFTAGGGMTFDF
jgi:hypothetical protein